MKKGKLVQFILDKFEAEPHGAWTTGDLVMEHYGVEWEGIKKSHRVAMIRAMKNIADSMPQMLAVDCEGARGQLIIYDGTDVQSRAMFRVKADSYRCYQMPYGWKATRGCKAFRSKHELEKDAEKISRAIEENAALAAPGGAWHRHTEMFKAEIEGDAEKSAELEAEQDAEMAALGKSFKRKLKGTLSFDKMRIAAAREVMKMYMEYPDECAEMEKEEGGMVFHNGDGGIQFKITRISTGS